MSTKINARSPFFIEATEPTVSAGIFDCNTANLLNFAVSSAGDVTEPNIQNGVIIDRTATSFAANTSGSAISRSVTYRIKIPAEYSNSSAGTLNCVQTVNQPTQTAAENPPQNPNCPTFAGAIQPITNLTSTTVNLASFFTAGSGATISGYNVQNYGAAAIQTFIANNTLTIATNSNCAVTTLRVTAFNSNDACTAVSNIFSVTAPCSKDLTCTIQDSNSDKLNLQGGDVSATGVITKPSYDIAHLVRMEDTSGNTITSMPPNGSASTQNAFVVFVFLVPAGYTNAGQELNCQMAFTQQTTAAPKVNLVCSDVTFSGFSITSQGNIIGGNISYLGTNTSVATSMVTETSAIQYDVVSSATSRTITVGFKILSTVWLNYNSNFTCTVDLTQPPSDNPCDSTSGTYYISNQGFTSRNAFCDFGATYSITKEIFGTPVSGQTVCFQGDFFPGDFKYYAFNENPLSVGAGNIGASFQVMKIDGSGTILEIRTVNCEGDTDGDDAI